MGHQAKITNFDGLAPQRETAANSCATSPWSKTYAARVGEILTKSRAGNAQQLSDEEFQFALAAWLEVLYGAVPEHRLNDCYVFAKRNRSTTFALQPEELCMAWNEIRQSEMHKQPNAKQLTHGFCEKCNNTNTEAIRNERGAIIAGKPCSH